jgi:hypothetical protein
VHASLGAEVLNICASSVTVKASLARWEQWTGHDLKRPGNYQISGALAPLSLDGNAGTYVEPNVWVRYRL